LKVRVVCATNRKLEEEIQNGTFREDFLSASTLSIFRFRRWRNRRGDIPELANYFLDFLQPQIQLPGESRCLLS